MSENITRRDLIKLMTLAGAAMCRPVSLLADALPVQTASAGSQPIQLASHPRLFYNASSLEPIRQMLAADTAANADLKNVAKNCSPPR